MLISFLAAVTSRWRLTKVIPSYLSLFLFQIIPVLIIFVYLFKFIFHSPILYTSIALIDNKNLSNIELLQKINLSLYYNQKSHNKINHSQYYKGFRPINNFITLSLPIQNSTDIISNMIELSKNFKTIILFSTKSACAYIQSGKIHIHNLWPPEKPFAPIRFKMNNILSFSVKESLLKLSTQFSKVSENSDDTEWKIGLIVGRETLRPEYFAAENLDFMITIGGSSYDESLGL